MHSPTTTTIKEIWDEHTEKQTIFWYDYPVTGLDGVIPVIADGGRGAEDKAGPRALASLQTRLFVTLCRQEGNLLPLFHSQPKDADKTPLTTVSRRHGFLDGDIDQCPLTGEDQLRIFASLKTHKYKDPSLSGFETYLLGVPIDLPAYIEAYGLWPCTREEATEYYTKNRVYYLEHQCLPPPEEGLSTEPGCPDVPSNIMAAIGEHFIYWKTHEWSCLLRQHQAQSRKRDLVGGTEQPLLFSSWIPPTFVHGSPLVGEEESGEIEEIEMSPDKIIASSPIYYFLEGFPYQLSNGQYPHLCIRVPEAGMHKLSFFISCLQDIQALIEAQMQETNLCVVPKVLQFPIRATRSLDEDASTASTPSPAALRIDVGGKRYKWNRYIWPEELIPLMTACAIVPSPRFMHMIVESALLLRAEQLETLDQRGDKLE